LLREKRKKRVRITVTGGGEEGVTGASHFCGGKGGKKRGPWMKTWCGSRGEPRGVVGRMLETSGEKESSTKRGLGNKD